MKKLFLLLTFLSLPACNSTKVVPDAEKVAVDAKDLVQDTKTLETDLTATTPSQVS